MLHTYLNQSNPSELTDSVKVILTLAVESWTPHQLMLRLEDLMKDANAHTAFKHFSEQLAKDGSYGSSLCLLIATAI